ncbi:hypothetical protein Dsin_002816 [Dipteronia sinensis]|uniref:Reverse transcriptase zinc-binding domain-containing protein n=1 Tax=Dipteronia sinensis TaxID=43782 RepID=A0AAE0ELK9_9ROSI|nr:hypothetical protein Dsin_002816 [Dipteronia sinensis]
MSQSVGESQADRGSQSVPGLQAEHQNGQPRGRKRTKTKKCNLAQRGIQIDVSCPICGKQPETTVHALWSCSAIKGIRSMCDSLKNIKVANNFHFQDIMVLCKNILRVDEFELLCMVLWIVWYRRNRSIHDSKLLADSEVVPWAAFFIAEYRGANIGVTGDVGKEKNPPQKWSPPSEGKIKMNTDAAIKADFGRVGVGIIFRDSTGNVLASSAL